MVELLSGCSVRSCALRDPCWANLHITIQPLAARTLTLINTTETARCVVKGNARQRDPRLEQEPTDTVAVASTRTLGLANFRPICHGGRRGRVNTRAHEPPPLATHLRGLTEAEQTRAKAEHH
ncbi:unnamed protein product [Pleuronectes platessa]|uniref:Uncharacterized protein n=1 Tax=Pleuronectes platessa TaxID=8262 RepID=A0A9N7UER3_PLEPL|nr:unnamed protein product [Pleuronectes platessa]